MFRFSLRNIEYEIQANLSQCENVDFNTCVHKIFSSLWVLTEECLRCLREMLDSVKDIMQSELTELVSDILKILGNDKYRMSTLSNAVTSCSTELQMISLLLIVGLNVVIMQVLILQCNMFLIHVLPS